LSLGIRAKLFTISVALILLGALVSGVLVETVMRGGLIDRVTYELDRVAMLNVRALEIAQAPLDTLRLQQAAERLAHAADVRITVIARTGEVLADSALDAEQVRSAENHALRPEVQAALAAGRGLATRYSETLRADLMYLAVPYTRPDSAGIIRVSMSLASIDALIAKMRWLITLAGLLGLLVAGLMGGLASHFASRSLMNLVARARSLSVRPQGARLMVKPNDELAGLAGSFNRLADELDRTIEALSDERDRTQAVLDSLSEAVLGLDATTGITELNRAARTLLGLSDVPAGTPLVEVIRVPQLMETVAEAQQGRSAHTELIWPGPPRRVLSASASPQRTRGRCVVVLRDVTELRRLETMRRDFVANLSHELRTPVSIISANVETLAGGALQDPKRAPEFLSAVQRNAERLARLVSDLLDLSRIEAGHQEIELKPMRAEASVGAVFELLEGRARSKEIEFEVSVEDDVMLVADPRALEHVLVNLLENAIKYTPAKGQVGIDVRADADDVLFEVWDTGPGVPEAHRARLFERFYRVDPGRSRDMGGTGLGLSIVKHLVEAMRGKVGMRPRSDGGSVFWVRLPAPRATAA
jgi:two-component system phosphate regulon sensor histidine kinase PhoR